MKSRSTKKFECKCGKWIYRILSCSKPCPVCGGKMQQVIKLRNNHHWTEEEDNYLRKHYKTRFSSDIAKDMGLTKYQVRNRLTNLKLKLPPKELEKRKSAHRFKKGQISHNKGKKMSQEQYERCKHTFFQKGNLPVNTLYDGAVTIRYDHANRRGGRHYKWIRISKANWVMLHVHIWEQEHGPVPEGHIIVFKDKDTMNVKLENLMMLTLEENMDRNRNYEKCSVTMKKRWESSEWYENDLWIAKLIARGSALTVEEILQRQELIKLKRNQLLLKRAIKNGRKTQRKAG